MFDTTSSNTGRFKGSATAIESTLNKAVLWLACYHHVYEIHVKHVSDYFMGKKLSFWSALGSIPERMVGNGSRHILFDYDVEKELQKVADEVFDLSSCVCFNCLVRVWAWNSIACCVMVVEWINASPWFLSSRIFCSAAANFFETNLYSRSFSFKRVFNSCVVVLSFFVASSSL